MLTLVLCCIESVCRADGIEVPGIDMTHLADYINAEDMSSLAKDLMKDTGNA